MLLITVKRYELLKEKRASYKRDISPTNDLPPLQQLTVKMADEAAAAAADNGYSNPTQ